MTDQNRQRLACSSYWLLFIILPSCAAVCFFDVSWSIGLPVFIGLILIGEHGYRPWRRIWGLAEREKHSLTDPKRF